MIVSALLRHVVGGPRVRRATGRRLPVRRLAGLLLTSAALAGPARAQAPSPEEVLGYGLGQRFATVTEVRAYMDALAQASPLVSVHPYGETPEGRELVQVLFASADHRAQLDEILARNRELTDPETPPERAAEIAQENPAVVYLSYGVHGNESSSPNAAMWTAWDLVRGGEGLGGALDEVIVVVDPFVNPDGYDRYVNFYRGARGLEPDPDPSTREHDEPWPGGRTNHYYFDLNRDWAWRSQPETRARLATWSRWSPQVHVDFHEMGANSTYFFFPATRPINPVFPEHILEWGERFGRANAAAFDARGWLYYTAEGFDLFYPGYGDSWPSLLGAIGMTYEQAGGGSAGLVFERGDGTLLRLSDRIMHHRTTGNTTIRTAARGRSELLQGFADFHRDVDEGLSDILLVPGEDPERVEALVRFLLEIEVRVEKAPSEVALEAAPFDGWEVRASFPVGTYRVPARQPRGRLAMALLAPEWFLDAEFSYDISAWSLPYAYGVEAHELEGGGGSDWAPVTLAPRTPTGTGAAPGAYAYLLTPGFDVAPALADFLEAGGRAYALSDTFTISGRRYPYGTTVIPRGRNDDLERRIEESGLTPWVDAVESGWTEGGPDLGTGGRGTLEMPKIALLGGQGASSSSFGAHWYFLERILEIPFDAVQVSDVSDRLLEEYDVVIAPSGVSRGSLGESGHEALEDWIRAGGTLVAVDGAARSLGSSLGGVETREEDEEVEDEDEERLRRALRTREERERERWQEQIPGTILAVELDPRHPLSWGAAADGSDGVVYVLTNGDSFEPDPSFETVGHFPEGLERVSGVISEENLARLERSAWVAERGLGGGKIVLFADDPLFRLFWYSGFQLYANAILLGPAF